MKKAVGSIQMHEVEDPFAEAAAGADGACSINGTPFSPSDVSAS